MKRYLKNILSCFLSGLLLFGAACTNGGNGTSDSNSSNNGGNEEKTYMNLVEDGQSSYSIVISENATECEAFAAEELSSFVKQITGATLPIKTDAGTVFNSNEKVISIGKTSILEGSGINTAERYPQLNLTGFYIDTIENTVILDAYKDVGVLYSVYELLEKYGGVRFVTEDFTYVPESQDFVIEEGLQLEAPAFQLRSYLTGIFYSDKLFMARKRFGAEWGAKNLAKYGYGNEVYMTPGSPYTHDHLYLVPPSTYYAEYPQMFWTVGNTVREICLTYGITENGEIDSSVPVSPATIMLEHIKTYLTNNPECEYFFIGQEDHLDYCKCDTCKARTEQYGGYSSAILVIYCNAILKELLPWVESQWPGRNVNIATFAYHQTERPPVNFNADGSITPVDPLVIPDEHLYIRIAPIRGNFLYSFDDPRQNEQYDEVFKGWPAITDNFWLWDYSTNYGNFELIFPNIATMQENYQYYREIGVTYCLTQADHRNTNSFQERMKVYVSSRLMWNPDLVVEDIMNEFFTLYFQEYSGTMLEFWNMWTRHLYTIAEDPTLKFYLAENNMFNVYDYKNYPLPLLEKSMNMINEAIATNAANTSISEEERETMRKRLLGALLVPERTLLMNYSSYYGADTEADFARMVFDHMDDVGGHGYYSEGTLSVTKKAQYGL